MARPVKYRDENGVEQNGWYEGGHVYQDEGLSTPIGVGSTYSEGGKTWKMTENGGQLWSQKDQYDKNGNWVPQGNPYYVQSQETLEQIRNRGPFQFDLNGNALYQTYKNQYLHNGQRAMQDTMGKAAALTGGYGSSYGQNVGQQAYNEYLTKLNEVVPDIYAQERAAYDKEGQDLYNRWNMLNSMYQNDYANELQRQQWMYQQQQDRISQAIQRWQLLGYADANIAEILGVPEGAKTSDQAYQDWLIQQQGGGTGAVGGGGSSSGGGSGGSTYKPDPNRWRGDLYGYGDSPIEEDPGTSYGGGYGGGSYTGGGQTDTGSSNTGASGDWLTYRGGTGLDQATYNGLVRTVQEFIRSGQYTAAAMAALQYEAQMSQEQINWINAMKPKD